MKLQEEMRRVTSQVGAKMRHEMSRNMTISDYKMVPKQNKLISHWACN